MLWTIAAILMFVQSVNVEICAEIFFVWSCVSVGDGGIFKTSIELFITLLAYCPYPPGVYSMELHGGQKFWVWFVIKLLLMYLLALNICHEADDHPMNYPNDRSFTKFISSKPPGRIACRHHICRILGSHLPCISGTCRLL